MISAEKKSVRKQRKVPDYLVYEMMDGKPIYYRGYQEVLNKRKKPEDIMGSSALQGVILSFIVSVLYKYLNQDEHWILINEPGVHLDHKNNLAGDILVYENVRLKTEDIKNRYVNTPANVVVEVDTKADLSKQGFETYLKNKTTKFHQFGVDKIIWILTASKQVIIAEPAKDWLMVDWNKDIEIINGIRFNIGSYLAKKGIVIEEE
ncbi:MAG: hypothetical protein JWQ09_3006 [Segetibacter sp.]|nr:hypothetical protein [Segetibacter sp.]